MPENVAELRTMQLGIGRHRREAGMPDGVKRFEIIRAVLGGDGDAVAGRKLERFSQGSGQPRHPGGERRVIAHDQRADRERRQRGVTLSRAFKPQRDIHDPAALPIAGSLAVLTRSAIRNESESPRRPAN
jgi:hypothetical protein